MKNKKFFKRLSAVVIGFWLGISSAASIGAISPVDLWEKIDAYKSETSILNDYETFIKPNLSENGFGQSHLQTARNLLFKETSSNDEKGLSLFKNYAYNRLLLAQSEIFTAQQDIDSKMLSLKENNTISTILKALEKNSGILGVRQEIENIKLFLKNCESISGITFLNCSLGYVRQQQQIFYKNYYSLQDHIKSAFKRIKTSRAACQKSQEHDEKTSLHLNFANNYSCMLNSILPCGFGYFI